MERTAIGVGIIEDQRLTRELLATMLSESDGYRVAGVFDCMEEALPRIGRDLPDVALVDIGLPGMSGIQGIRLLRERFPSLLPLVLTVYEDDERVFDAICAGACGYILKRTPCAGLLNNIHELVNGGAPM
jgi:DNA-binding NarL/FixJ family response regulator